MSKNGDGHMIYYIWSFQDCPDGEDEKGAAHGRILKFLGAAQ